MKKPLIGITSSIEPVPERINTFKASSGLDYSQAVINAGGVPFIMPTHNDSNVLREQLKYIDGLLLAGGGDPNPIFYGEDCLENIGEISIERDEFELFVLAEFLKTGKPIFGICRGLQLINIFLGGTLYQDISYIEREIKIQHRQLLRPDLPSHSIKIEKYNILFDIFGENTRVNSFHHQMIKDIGKGLSAIATSVDGVIEAFQYKSHPFLYGVQWHPEVMAVKGNKDMKKLFEIFINSCKI